MPGFHIGVKRRKVAGGSLLPSSICHALGTAVERIKRKRLNMVPHRSWLKCHKIPVTMPVTKSRMSVTMPVTKSQQMMTMICCRWLPKASFFHIKSHGWRCRKDRETWTHSTFSGSLRYRKHDGCGCRRDRKKWFPCNLKWLRLADGNGSSNACGSLSAVWKPGLTKTKSTMMQQQRWIYEQMS